MAALTTDTAQHDCAGYDCPAVHLAPRDARTAVREHVADGWDLVTTTRDTVTLSRGGERLMITTARRMIEPWE